MSQIALIGENSLEYISILIDIWNNDDCAVLIDSKTPIDTILEILLSANISKCFIDKTLYNKTLFDDNLGINFVFFESTKGVVELPAYIYEKFIPNDGNTDAVVIFSSGTTGKSKGIILTHKAINFNSNAILNYMAPGDRDCIYIVKPLSHSSTLIGELLVGLKSKTRIIISQTIVPPRTIFENIGKYSVTIICVNPRLLKIYADEFNFRKYNISSLHTIYVSGDILNFEIYGYAKRTFCKVSIQNVYGMTEAGPRITAQTERFPGDISAGKPLKGIEIAIVNESGVKSDIDELGIIHINSPSLFKGYLSGEAKSLSLYNNWFNTGDIGYIDYIGNLHIIGRKDDMIIIDAHKIYPTDIEEYIKQHFILDECIVVKASNKGYDFLACFYTGEYIPDKSFINALSTKFLPYEIPRLFFNSKNVPMTITGKISRNNIRDIINNYLQR